MSTLTNTIRIDLPFGELTTRRDVTRKECYMELYEDHICYKVVVEYSTDESGIWSEKKANYRWTRKKSMLSDVAMYYDNIEEQWTLSVDFAGISGDGCAWMYLSPKECLTAYETLKKWWIE